MKSHISIFINSQFCQTGIGIYETKITEIESLYISIPKKVELVFCKNNTPAIIFIILSQIKLSFNVVLKSILQITHNGIITNGLIYKHSVDINVEYFTIALEIIISSLDPNKTTNVMGNFNTNLLDYNNSAPIDFFLIKSFRGIFSL